MKTPGRLCQSDLRDGAPTTLVAAALEWQAYADHQASRITELKQELADAKSMIGGEFLEASISADRQRLIAELRKRCVSWLGGAWECDVCHARWTGDEHADEHAKTCPLSGALTHTSSTE